MYQNASVSPLGNITNNFNRFESGPNATANWVWATTKSGQGIVRGTIPTTTDYTKPVYAVKYTTVSYLKDTSTSTVVTGSEVTHLECGFFYAIAPTAQPICGNGQKEGTEQCDDGNTSNNDACLTTCRLPVCGNAIREGTEQCDDGNTNNNDACNNQCRTSSVAICGNGVPESTEQCDDGNTNNNDACSNACRLPVCGNAIREGTEQCDDGNTRNGDTCTSQCRTPGATSVCGNGIPEGSEECDDGNVSNTDSCSTVCRILGSANPQCRVQAFDAYGSVPLTTTFSCSGEPRGRTVIIITKNNTLIDTSETTSKTFTFNQSGRYTIRCYPDAANNQSNSCTTVINVNGQCGNGLVEQGEMCDDGNIISGDLCDRSCRLTGTSCGNGMLENGEQCDDGNNSNNDTCNNICQSGMPPTGPLGMITALLITALLGAAGIVYYRSRKS